MNDNNIIPTEDFIPVVGNNNLYQDACAIIDSAKRYAYKQVDETLVKRNWLLGLRIQHEVLKDKRAEYGKHVIKELSNSLTQRYGEGFKPAKDSVGQMAFRFLVANSFKVHFLHFELHLGDSYQKQRL